MKHFQHQILLSLLIFCGLFLFGCGTAQNQNNVVDGTPPPAIFVDDAWHGTTGHRLPEPAEDSLELLGYVTEVISESESPTENLQANFPIKGAPLYRCTDESLYEQNFLLSGDVLVYYDETYYIYETEEHRHVPNGRRVKQATN